MCICNMEEKHNFVKQTDKKMSDAKKDSGGDHLSNAN